MATGHRGRRCCISFTTCFWHLHPPELSVTITYKHRKQIFKHYYWQNTKIEPKRGITNLLRNYLSFTFPHPDSNAPCHIQQRDSAKVICNCSHSVTWREADRLAMPTRIWKTKPDKKKYCNYRQMCNVMGGTAIYRHTEQEGEWPAPPLVSVSALTPLRFYSSTPTNRWREQKQRDIVSRPSLRTAG